MRGAGVWARHMGVSSAFLSHRVGARARSPLARAVDKRTGAVSTQFAMLVMPLLAMPRLPSEVDEDELDELPPIEITLPADGRTEGDVVPVRLRSRVTEVGTLLLEAEPVRPLKTDERWRVELSVRGGE